MQTVYFKNRPQATSMYVCIPTYISLFAANVSYAPTYLLLMLYLCISNNKYIQMYVDDNLVLRGDTYMYAHTR
jgi:hypothetical protein